MTTSGKKRVFDKYFYIATKISIMAIAGFGMFGTYHSLTHPKPLRAAKHPAVTSQIQPACQKATPK